MPLTKKLLVSGLMSLGLVATGFGIARAATLGTSTEDITCRFRIYLLRSGVVKAATDLQFKGTTV
jgi:hypothetical protein